MVDENDVLILSLLPTVTLATMSKMKCMKSAEKTLTAALERKREDLEKRADQISKNVDKINTEIAAFNDCVPDRKIVRVTL